MNINKLSTVRSYLVISLVIFPLVILSSCRGPMGPAGEDGINYTGSIIYDIGPSDWEGDINGYSAYIDVPEITEDIYYDGAVLVYRLFEADPKSFNALPYTYVDNALTIYMDYDAYIGGINLLYKEVFDGVNNTPVPAGTMTFKVIIVQGVPIATLRKMVNVSDFNAVAKFLDIEAGHSVIR